ncbi:hypothetical protein ScPMuIL_014248 [Solemya velum]
MGASLVRIEDAAENAWIHSQVNTGNGPHWWIGLVASTTDETHEWNDCPGEPAHYTNWMAGEPNNHTDEGCVKMEYDSGAWNDVPCSKTLNFICEKRLTEETRCSSWKYKYNKCGTEVDRTIRDLCVLKQRSKAECAWGISYLLSTNDPNNPDDTKFSVDDGCRADFRVYF